jgi:hypothetical protein
MYRRRNFNGMHLEGKKLGRVQTGVYDIELENIFILVWDVCMYVCIYMYVSKYAII